MLLLCHCCVTYASLLYVVCTKDFFGDLGNWDIRNSYRCVTAVLQLFYCRVTVVLLLCYCCVTDVSLLRNSYCCVTAVWPLCY